LGLHADVWILRDGQVVAVISARDPRWDPVKELRRELGQAAGRPIPFSVWPTDGPAIVLGTAKEFPEEAKRFSLPELGPEGYVLRTEGNFV